MKKEQETEMETWYSNNITSKKLEIFYLGLMLLPFLAVLMNQQSSGTRLCLLICMCLNLIASVAFWLLKILYAFKQSEWWAEQISPFPQTPQNDLAENTETMNVNQKNDEQFVIRTDEYKTFAYVAIALFVLSLII